MAQGVRVWDRFVAVGRFPSPRKAGEVPEGRRGHFAQPPPRRLGTVQRRALLALKPFNNYEFASSAASRHAALKSLAPPELARTTQRLARRLNEAVKGLSKAALYSLIQTFSQSKQRFGTGTACTKTLLRPLACLVSIASCHRIRRTCIARNFCYYRTQRCSNRKDLE